MNNEILFKEKQRFKKWWVLLILLSINGFFLFAVYKQVIESQQFGAKPINDTGLIILTGLTTLLTLLFFNIRLDTQIKTNGINVRFFPFHFSYKYYPWDSLTKSYVRHYSAISEYGGWGLRHGLFGKGNALIISGDKGLQLEFKNNKKLLIGTKKPDDITETLHKIGQLKE